MFGQQTCCAVAISWATAVQADEEVFNREAKSSVCFSQNGKPPTERTTYQDFRRLNVKWQMKLAKRFKDCLQSEEYVQTRNALLILNKVVKVSSMVRSEKQRLPAWVRTGFAGLDAPCDVASGSPTVIHEPRAHRALRADLMSSVIAVQHLDPGLAEHCVLDVVVAGARSCLHACMFASVQTSLK